MMTALSVRNVSYRFGARTALNDVSFDLEAGRFAALLGPNGAGKSTLFALLTRLLVTRHGQIFVAGFDVRAAPRAALARIGALRINCFGHLGDGNLHYNVFPAKGRTRADHEDQREAIKRCVHDLVDAMGGSVSAEHGIGRLKTGDLARYGDPAKLAMMRAIKAALDPQGIMNPGALFGEDGVVG